VLVFVSGGKGVHAGIRTVWVPEPSPDYHAVAKRFCLDLAERAGVAADGSIYSKTRIFRAPNSRHASGLFKRRLSLDELTHLGPEAVRDLARRPEPFDIPTGPDSCPTAAVDWEAARRSVGRQAQRHAVPREGPEKLNALTLDFIRDGAPAGERAVRVFRAAANLAELGCTTELAHALLYEVALDSGLAPTEARRQIDTGLDHTRKKGGAA